MLLLQLLIAAVLVAVVAVAGTKGMVALMGRFAGGKVSRIFADAEYIIDHHAVPPAWQEKLRKSLRGLRPGGEDAGLAARHRARARRSCLRELERLLSFARKTSIVADEESRRILVSELQQVREEWQNRGWDEMCARDTGLPPTAAAPGPEE